MLRAVIDTNVFITALLHGKAPRRVYEAFLNGDMVCIVSDEMLAELLDVLSRPEFRRSIPSADITDLVNALRRDALMIRPTSTVRVCRDPDETCGFDRTGLAAQVLAGRQGPEDSATEERSEEEWQKSSTQQPCPPERLLRHRLSFPSELLNGVGL